MKPLDDDKLDKITNKILDYIAKTEFKTQIGKVNIELPRSIIYSSLGFIKRWEADDVSDILKNYSLVDKASLEPQYLPENAQKLKETLDKAIESANLNEYERIEITQMFQIVEKVSSEICREFGWRNKHSNPNIIVMDNVYLGDFIFSESKWYDRCNLIVRDRNQKTIPAIAVYANRRFKDRPEINELEDILKSAKAHGEYNKPFDISFQVLPKYRIDLESIVPGGILETVYKGPALRILSVTKTDDGDNKTRTSNPVDIGTLIPQFN
jgi:hypothetical protein